MARTYKIVAVPNYMTVKTGETVVYRLAPVNPMNADYTFDWEPQWLQINGSDTGRPGEPMIQTGPIAESWTVKFDQPGKYAIACMAWKTKPDPAWTRKSGVPSLFREATPEEKRQWDAWETSFYPQCVESEDAFLFDPVMGQTTHTLDPYSVLSGLKRYRTVLYQVGVKQFPNPAVVKGTQVYQEHQEELETLDVEIEALTRRLSSTLPAYMGGANQDIWERHPITAVHHLDDGSDSELKLYLAKRIPAVAGTFRQPTSGSVDWKLVDWTNPVDRGRTGEYDGSGTTDYEGVMTAIKVWSNYYPLRIGNRYPKGTVSYTIPAGFCSKTEITSTFQTDGTTWWDDLDEFLAWVGILSMVVVGIITLIAPVPGSQLASVAIWVGLAGAISGAAQAAIHLGEAYQDDFNRDWKEEAVDVLTIVACLFGVGASWARGAAIKGLIPLRTARGIFYGSIAIDAMTGVVMVDAHVNQMESLMKDTSLTPGQKIKKMMLLFGQLAGQSALLFVNMKASAKEVANFKSPQPKGPKGDTELPPAERLKKLADPKEEIDGSKVPKMNGHTDEGQHTGIIRDDPYRAPIVADAPPPPPPPPPPRRTLADALKDPATGKKAETWWSKEITPTAYKLVRKLPGSEQNRNVSLRFEAELDHGVIHVEMVQTKKTTGKRVDVRAPDFRADELYPAMFEHFDQTAKASGTPIKGIRGEFAFDNLRGVEEKLLNTPQAKEMSAKDPSMTQAKLLESMPPETVAACLDGAPSWKYWQKYADSHGYTLKPVPNRIGVREDGHAGLIRHVEWEFTLEKK